MPSGSSPRVRSRRWRPPWCRRNTGIISACAEQTRRVGIPRRRGWDHLRVCGADGPIIIIGRPYLGSSPRVRSRPWFRSGRASASRIISACAEQTGCPHCDAGRSWDHLRVCGADGLPLDVCRNGEGSSPRVRSRRLDSSSTAAHPGIISACAEQTLLSWCSWEL